MANGHTIAEYRAALISTGGMQALAAKRLGVTRAAVCKRVAGSNELKQIIADQREEMLDEAEVGLRAATSDREAWAICFTLKTIGKSRGYIERTETDLTSGGKAFAFTLQIAQAQDDADSDRA